MSFLPRAAVLAFLLASGCGRVRYAPAEAGVDLDAPAASDAPTDAPASDVGVLPAPIQFADFIKASNTGVDDEFGTAVVLSADGNTLAIGAIYEDSAGTGVNPPNTNSELSAGAVYIYARVGMGWEFQAFIKASNTDAYDEFGNAIALSADGNTLAVGAPKEDGSGTGVAPASDESATESGAVYVYTRSGTTWSFEAYIKASNTGRNDAFGSAVALSGSGDLLAVGAPGEDTDGTRVDPPFNENASNSGAVYLYSRSASTWALEHCIKSTETATGDAFGSAVAINAGGTLLAVGAPERASGGAAYIYSGLRWNNATSLRAENAARGDRFGFALALQDGLIAIGAPGEATNAPGINPTPNRRAPNTGAAYLFAMRAEASWEQDAFIKASNASVDEYGWSLALSAAGDRLVVGGIFEDGAGMGIDATPSEGFIGSGAAYVYLRTGSAWFERHYIKAFNVGAGDHFGGSVALSSDGNTLAVGAPLESSSGTGVGSTPNEGAQGSGAVYVYR